MSPGVLRPRVLPSARSPWLWLACGRARDEHGAVGEERHKAGEGFAAEAVIGCPPRRTAARVELEFRSGSVRVYPFVHGLATDAAQRGWLHQQPLEIDFAAAIDTQAIAAINQPFLRGFELA